MQVIQFWIKSNVFTFKCAFALTAFKIKWKSLSNAIELTCATLCARQMCTKLAIRFCTRPQFSWNGCVHALGNQRSFCVLAYVVCVSFMFLTILMCACSRCASGYRKFCDGFADDSKLLCQTTFYLDAFSFFLLYLFMQRHLQGIGSTWAFVCLFQSCQLSPLANF